MRRVYNMHMAKKLSVRFTRHYAREWREHRKLTLEEAGYRMGRSHTLLSRIERRLVGLSQPTLDEMSRVYRVTRGTILDRPPSKDE
jgi:transcriptional regulator with XRE-family HTH domain